MKLRFILVVLLAGLLSIGYANAAPMIEEEEEVSTKADTEEEVPIAEGNIFIKTPPQQNGSTNFFGEATSLFKKTPQAPESNKLQDAGLKEQKTSQSLEKPTVTKEQLEKNRDDFNAESKKLTNEFNEKYATGSGSGKKLTTEEVATKEGALLDLQDKIDQRKQEIFKEKAPEVKQKAVVEQKKVEAKKTKTLTEQKSDEIQGQKTDLSDVREQIKALQEQRKTATIKEKKVIDEKLDRYTKSEKILSDQLEPLKPTPEVKVEKKSALQSLKEKIDSQVKYHKENLQKMIEKLGLKQGLKQARQELNEDKKSIKLELDRSSGVQKKMYHEKLKELREEEKDLEKKKNEPSIPKKKIEKSDEELLKMVHGNTGITVEEVNQLKQEDIEKLYNAMIKANWAIQTPTQRAIMKRYMDLKKSPEQLEKEKEVEKKKTEKAGTLNKPNGQKVGDVKNLNKEEAIRSTKIDDLNKKLKELTVDQVNNLKPEEVKKLQDEINSLGMATSGKATAALMKRYINEKLFKPAQ